MNARKTGLVGVVLAGLLGLGLAAVAPASAAAAPAAPVDAGAGVFAKGSEARAVPVRTSRGVDGRAAVSNLDGFCDIFSNGLGDFCIFETDNFTGGAADFFSDDPNVFGARFPGTNISVGANAVSGINLDSFRFLLAYTGTGFTGTSGFAAPGQGGVFADPFLRNIGSLEFA